MELNTNTTSSPEVPKSVINLRHMFDLDQIEALRLAEREAYDLTEQEDLTAGYSVELSEHNKTQVVDNLIEQHLTLNGAERGSAEFEQYKTALAELSILSIPNSEWSAKLGEGDSLETGISGRDRTRGLFEQLSGEPYYVLAGGESEATDQDVLADWHAELDTLRDTFAVCSATRQGRVFGRGGEKYQEAKIAYNEQLIALAKLENESIVNDTEMSDDEKKLKITEYLFTEQAKLRVATTEKLKGTKVGRFVEAMNRGNIAVRIAKGLILGVGVGLAGAGIGALAGVAGVATLGAGVAAVGTATVRFARGFARKDAKAGRGMAELDQSTHSIDTPTSDNGNDYIDSITQHFDNAFETDTKLEQKKRRSSIKWGIGALALGVVAAEAGHLIADANLFHGWMNRNDLPSIGSHHAQQPGMKPSIHDNNNGASGSHGDVIPPAGGTTPELPVAGPEFSAEALNVTPGEGWYNTFKEMGITNQTEQANLLQKVGPKLQEMGLAYKMPHGLYGISHPGQLTNDVLELIKSSR